MADTAGAKEQLPRARILLADDHALVLERCKTLLQEKFEIVGVARDGFEMVSQAAVLSPDVIVADISMPRLSGIEAWRRIREISKKSNVVFLTIHTDNDFVEACMAEGALGYVFKSQMKSDLIPAIEAALAGRKHISAAGSIRH